MIITSSQNSKVKLVRVLLSSKKERDKNNLFVLEGVRNAEESMAAGLKPLFALFSNHLSNRGFEIVELLKNRQIETEEIAPDLLNRISDTRSSQGILLVLPIPQKDLPVNNQLVLVLDQLRDPGNLGTMLRSAAALGFETIFLTPESVDPYSPKVVRSAMGAHFKSNILVMTAPRIMEFCKSINRPLLKIVLADAQSDNKCWEMDFSEPICLVIGGEADGVTNELKSMIDDTVAIPMNAGSESFNAAISGSILMYEVYRQRNQA